MKQNCPAWLKSAVFYQIYPQSFYDSNGDGIGDIPGIVEKLDYIQSLGCNAIWLNPCFESPFYDAGYDVADYCKVAKRYGTNADLKRLFNEAAKRDIKVCLDLVPAHTSIEHPWFKKSSLPRKNKHSNYYIWTSDWAEAPQPPLDAIKGYAQRNGNYISSFFWSQPALNYGFAKPDPAKPWQLDTNHPACLAVQREIIKVMRYWLDMGASGFRVDMPSTLIKNDKNWKKTSEFWRKVRLMFDKSYPDAVLISEWGFPIAAIKAGFHLDFLLIVGTPAYNALFRQEMEHKRNPDAEKYSFFSSLGKGNITLFLDSYLRHYRKTRQSGYISIATGNHDLPRISVGRTQKEIELVFALILTLPGVPFIYYGDEIGMKYLKDLPSKEGGYSRCGSRTPMQWTDAKNAGFSKASDKRLYLPMDKSKRRPTVDSQERSPTSLLNKVRSLISLRRQNHALCGEGDFLVLYGKTGKYPFVYMRKSGRKRFLIALNPSNKAVSITFKTSYIHNEGQIMLKTDSDLSLSYRNSRCQLKMPPVSYGIFKM